MSFADLKKLKKLPNLEANDRRHVLKSQAVAVRRGLQVVLSSFITGKAEMLCTTLTVM